MWRVDSLEKTLMLGKTEGKRRRGWQMMRGLGSITDSMDMNLSTCQDTVEDRGARRAAVHRGAKSWTRLRYWPPTTMLYFRYISYTLDKVRLGPILEFSVLEFLWSSRKDFSYSKHQKSFCVVHLFLKFLLDIFIHFSVSSYGLRQTNK